MASLICFGFCIRFVFRALTEEMAFGPWPVFQKLLTAAAWFAAAIVWWRGGKTWLGWGFFVAAILLWDSIIVG